MARVKLHNPSDVVDSEIIALFDWVTEMEGKVPNHFLLELNFPEFMKAKLMATKVLWENGELTIEEIQHVGILVSRANGCQYCTGAFCTILSHGLGVATDYVNDLVERGEESIDDERLKAILSFSLKANKQARDMEDEDVEGLRKLGFSDKGIVQIVHLVSDFSSYNRLNLALDTDYDYEVFG